MKKEKTFLEKHPILRRFMRRKISVLAAVILILFVLIAIFGPMVWTVDPLKQSVMKKYGRPETFKIYWIPYRRYKSREQSEKEALKELLVYIEK